MSEKAKCECGNGLYELQLQTRDKRIKALAEKLCLICIGEIIGREWEEKHNLKLEGEE